MPRPLLLACFVTVLISLPRQSTGESTGVNPPMLQRPHLDIASVLRSLKELAQPRVADAETPPAAAATTGPPPAAGSAAQDGAPTAGSGSRSDRLSGATTSSSSNNTSPKPAPAARQRPTDSSANAGGRGRGRRRGGRGPSEAADKSPGRESSAASTRGPRPTSTSGPSRSGGGSGETGETRPGSRGSADGHGPADSTRPRQGPGDRHDDRGIHHGFHDHGDHGNHSDHDHGHIVVVDPLADWSDDHTSPPILDQHGHVFDQGEIDNAVRASIARWLARRRTFSVMCVADNKCVMSATSKPERLAEIATQGWMDRLSEQEDPCEGRPVTSPCCWTALQDVDFVRDFIKMLKERSPKLSSACQFLCVNLMQCYLSCNLTSFHRACEDHGHSFTTNGVHDHNHDHDHDEEDEGSPSTSSSEQPLEDRDAGPDMTVVIISCLVAFLAGIGGAALIACLWRRRKAAKERSDNTVHSIGSSTFAAGSVNDAYEELPGTVPEGKAKPNPRVKVKRVSSENEYTYIADYAAYRRSTLHPAARKLPTAPGLDEAGERSTDGPTTTPPPERGPAGSRAPPTYSLSQPIRARPQQYFELEKEAETAPGQPYAASEDLRCCVPDTRHPASAAGSDHGSPCRGAMEATGGTAGKHTNKGDHYAALCRECQLGDEEYTALGKEEYTALGKEEPRGTNPPEYLELVPDYSLQKPVH